MKHTCLQSTIRHSTYIQIFISTKIRFSKSKYNFFKINIHKTKNTQIKFYTKMTEKKTIIHRDLFLYYY